LRGVREVEGEETMGEEEVHVRRYTSFTIPLDLMERSLMHVVHDAFVFLDILAA
jgi:hypothetical protein